MIVDDPGAGDLSDLVQQTDHVSPQHPAICYKVPTPTQTQQLSM